MKKLYNRSKCLAFILACQTADGGFAHRPEEHANMEATRFAVDTLNILGDTNYTAYIRTSGYIKWVETCQNQDGGFRCVVEEGKSELDATYYAIRILTISNRIVSYKDRCIDWLNAHRCDGGFASYGSCDIDSTYYGIQALTMLGTQINQKNKIVEFIKVCEVPSGGFGNMPGEEEEDMDRTYEAIHTLRILEKPIPHRDIHIKWINSCSGPHGGFKNRPTRDAEMRSTYWALHSLKLLRTNPSQCNKHIRWICTHQSSDGEFANNTTFTSNLWYTYCAVHSLALLGYLHRKI